MYNIRMGQPEMNEFWVTLNEKVKCGPFPEDMG